MTRSVYFSTVEPGDENTPDQEEPVVVIENDDGSATISFSEAFIAELEWLPGDTIKFEIADNSLTIENVTKNARDNKELGSENIDLKSELK